MNFFFFLMSLTMSSLSYNINVPHHHSLLFFCLTISFSHLLHKSLATFFSYLKTDSFPQNNTNSFYMEKSKGTSIQNTTITTVHVNFEIKRPFSHFDKVQGLLILLLSLFLYVFAAPSSCLTQLQYKDHLRPLLYSDI